MQIPDLSFNELEKLKTPAYFYFKDLISHQYGLLKNSLPENFRVFFSFKANSHKSVISHLRNLGTFADVASSQELQLALDCGHSPKQIEFTGPGKSYQSLQLAIQSQIASIVVESLQELRLINDICKKLHLRASVSLRMSPKRYYLPNGKLSALITTQFGIDEALLPELAEELKKSDHIDLVGVHVFSQSQILNTDILKKNFSIALETAINLTDFLKTPLALVNLGGGFGIPYYENEVPLDLSTLKTDMTELLNKARQSPFLSQAHFYVESGRFLTGPSGLYIAQVLYTKTSHGKKFAILSGGFSQNMAACGFGQLIRRNYKISTVHRNSPAKKEAFTLAGPSCYTLDTLAVDIELPSLEAGDYVCFHNSGSYGPSFSPTQFLLFEPATEYFMENK